MLAAKVQVSLRIRAVSPEPSLLAHTSSESRGTFGQKARSLAPLNGWACAVKICHDRMLEDTNSLDASHFTGGVQIVYIFTVEICVFHDKTNKMTCAPSEDSDQPGHLPSVIRVFAVHLEKHSVLPNAQSDLSLRWAESHFVGFVMRRLICVFQCLTEIQCSPNCWRMPWEETARLLWYDQLNFYF